MSGSTTYGGAVKQVQAPSLGNNSSAYTSVMNVQGIHIGVSLILFQYARFIGLVAYSVTGEPNLDAANSFATLAFEKVRGKVLSAH
jgi:hypothetical protein